MERDSIDQTAVSAHQSFEMWNMLGRHVVRSLPFHGGLEIFILSRSVLLSMGKSIKFWSYKSSVWILIYDANMGKISSVTSEKLSSLEYEVRQKFLHPQLIVSCQGRKELISIELDRYQTSKDLAETLGFSRCIAKDDIFFLSFVIL